MPGTAMTTLLDDDWTVRPKTSIWEALMPGADSPRTVRLPHDALVARERSAEGAGRIAHYPDGEETEYLRTLTAPAEWADRVVLLEIEAAQRSAKLFLNDVQLAAWHHGTTPRLIPLDAQLRPGQDNELRIEVRTGSDSRWYAGSGLLRDVHLHVLPMVHLDPTGPFATTEDVDAERAVVRLTTEMTSRDRADAERMIVARVLDADGAEVARSAVPATAPAGETITVRQRLEVPRPRLWGTEDPYLYRVVVDLHERGQDGEPDGAPVHTLSAPLGIRTLRLDTAHGLRLNGESVKMRGACVHADNGPLGTAAVGDAEERRVRLLKEAGFNALRSAHNPMSPAMLDACDRLGVLVMDEGFDQWRETKNPLDNALVFDSTWREDVDAWIRQARRHPSVVLYSLGNEIPEIGRADGAILSRRLAERVRALDPTRPTTMGANAFLAVIPEIVAAMRERIAAATAAAADGSDAGGSDAGGQDTGGAGSTEGPDGGVNGAAGMMGAIAGSPATQQRVREALSAIDVAGVNYAEQLYDSEHLTREGLVLVGSETFPNRIGQAWPVIERTPQVIGDFTWTGWDYLGEVGIGRMRYEGGEDLRGEAPYPWRYAWCGDIDVTGARRPQSYFREIVFGLRTAPYLAVEEPAVHDRTPAAQFSQWSWTEALHSWDAGCEPGAPVHVDVYSSAAEVELLLNGRSLGRLPAGPEHDFQARFDVEYEPGELTAVAYSDGAETGRDTIASTSGPTRLVALPESEEVSAGPEGVVFLPIELRDAAGTLRVRESTEVRVTVDGPAELAGVVSANPVTEEAVTAAACRTYAGRAIAVVRPTGPGTITMTVSADGLETVTATVTAVATDAH